MVDMKFLLLTFEKSMNKIKTFTCVCDVREGERGEELLVFSLLFLNCIAIVFLLCVNGGRCTNEPGDERKT